MAQTHGNDKGVDLLIHALAVSAIQYGQRYVPKSCTPIRRNQRLKARITWQFNKSSCPG